MGKTHTSTFRSLYRQQYVLYLGQHIDQGYFTGTCGQDPPPFFLNIDFFSCKQHFATLYVSLDPVQHFATLYVSLDPVIHRELQNVIYMKKNIDVQEKGGRVLSTSTGARCVLASIFLFIFFFRTHLAPVSTSTCGCGLFVFSLLVIRFY